MAQSVQEKVIAIIAEQAVLEPSDVKMDATLEELGIDSLGLVESIFAIEEAFDISVPFNANDPEASGFDISSVRAIVAAVEGLVAQQAALNGRHMKRVVITGAGTINALAHDVAGTLAAFREGRCGITELDIRDKDRLSIQIGGQVHNWDPEAHFNRQQIVLYDKFTQFTLLAAREAVAQSGLTFAGSLGLEAGVILGTAGGGVNTWDENYRVVYEEGKNRVHPFVVPKLMNNAAASHVSMEFQLRGPSFTVATACASSNHAMGQAFQMVRSGDGAGHADRRIRGHALFRRHQGLGGPAGDVEGRLPAVLAQSQRDGAGRGGGDLRLRGI